VLTKRASPKLERVIKRTLESTPTVERKERSSEESEVEVFPRKGTADSVGSATFCFNLIGGCQETGTIRQDTRSHKRRSHKFYYNFTEVTITIPPLIRILGRLIQGGINLYSDGV
jgi:hypothetical protein